MTTKRQSDLRAFLKQEAAEGRSPTFNEMRAAIGQKSKAGIFRLVKGLEERGFIRRLPNRVRAIEVIDQSEFSRGYQAGYEAAAKKFGVEARTQ